MGKRVLVHEVYERDKKWEGPVAWKRVPVNPAREGWVVGLRRIVSGQHVSGGYDDQAYIKNAKADTVPFIVWWPSLRALPVPLEAIRLVVQSDPIKAYLMSEKERKVHKDFYREKVDLFPRSVNGRFK